MGFIDVAAGQVISAAHVDLAVGQSVMRFTNAAARTAQLPSPTLGMVSWLDDLKRLETFTGSVWEATVGVPYGLVGGVATTTSGLNNADITPTITVPAAPYARIMLVGLRANLTVTGTGTPPRLRIMRDGVVQLPGAPFNTSVPVAEITTIFGLNANTAAALKGNVDVPSGYTVTSYVSETQLWVLPMKAGAAL